MGMQGLRGPSHGEPPFRTALRMSGGFGGLSPQDGARSRSLSHAHAAPLRRYRGSGVSATLPKVNSYRLTPTPREVVPLSRPVQARQWLRPWPLLIPLAPHRARIRGLTPRAPLFFWSASLVPGSFLCPCRCRRHPSHRIVFLAFWPSRRATRVG